MLQKKSLSLFFVVFYFQFCGFAFAFSFSEEEEKENREIQAETQLNNQLSSIPKSCSNKLNKKKIAVIIGETHVSGRIFPIIYSDYGLHFQIINQKLRELGLKTYTPQEINAQIAQEEIVAALNNDPDAALSAATRLGASFILRGVIRSRSQINPIVRANEVFVNIAFTLSDSSGRTVSNVIVSGDSWSGSDTLSTALRIVREKSAYVIAKIYRDFCEK